MMAETQLEIAAKHYRRERNNMAREVAQGKASNADLLASNIRLARSVRRWQRRALLSVPFIAALIGAAVWGWSR